MSWSNFFSRHDNVVECGCVDKKLQELQGRREKHRRIRPRRRRNVCWHPQGAFQIDDSLRECHSPGKNFQFSVFHFHLHFCFCIFSFSVFRFLFVTLVVSFRGLGPGSAHGYVSGRGRGTGWGGQRQLGMKVVGMVVGVSRSSIVGFVLG